MITENKTEARKVVYTSTHMSINIEGVLRYDDNYLSKLFTDDGENKPGHVVRDWLKLQLALGKRVLPMGDCEGFDYQTGCPGHPRQPTQEELNKEFEQEHKLL